MTEADTLNDKEDMESQTLLTPTEKLYFKKVGSILKSSAHSRSKEPEASQSYYKPRCNVKLTNKRGIFRNMEFETYMHL